MVLDVLNLYKERGEFFVQILMQHIYLSFISIVLITIIGLSTGVFMTKYQWVASVVLRITSFLYTIPSIALFGFLVTITGANGKSAIIALVLYGILPIIRSTYTGIMEVDSQILEAAIGMGSTRQQLLYKVQLPLALPVIFSGFRTMVVMTIALGAIASFIGAGGLGTAIWRGISTNFPAMTMAGSLLVALLAIITDWVLELVENKLKKRILGLKKEGELHYAWMDS